MNTLNYYNSQAEQFYESTIHVNMDELYSAFLRYLPAQASILDLGCGSGRDALAFKNMGYSVSAIDFSEALVAKARQLTGLAVEQQSFYDLNERDQYEGIWACASLLHCERSRLATVLEKIISALKVEGICYMSFKYGTGDREKDGRSFTDLNEQQAHHLMCQFQNILLLQQWITVDKRPDRNEEWFNIFLKRLVHE